MEIESINKRRAPGRTIALECESTNTREEPVMRPTELSEVVGLS